jgi:hypothetical protein
MTKVYFTPIPLENLFPKGDILANGAEITLPDGKKVIFKKGMAIIPELEMVSGGKRIKVSIQGKAVSEPFVPESDYKDICKSCRGKGYNTNFHGIEGAADLDMVGFKTDLTVHVEYCFCQRGKQLQELVKEKQKEAHLLLLRQIFKTTKRREEGKVNKIWIMTMLRGWWKNIYNEETR